MSLEQERLWTYEYYCELPEDGNRYEVIDGKLYVTPVPSTVHQLLSMRLVHPLYGLQLAGRGYVLSAPVDLIMEGATPVQPDVVFLGADQRSQIEERFVRGAPRLVIEILSPSTARRDRTLKLSKYAQNSIPWYWIVDPEDQTLLALRLEGGSYRVEASLTVGDRFVWADFPEVAYDLAALFAPI